MSKKKKSKVKDDVQVPEDAAAPAEATGVEGLNLEFADEEDIQVESEESVEESDEGESFELTSEDDAEPAVEGEILADDETEAEILAEGTALDSEDAPVADDELAGTELADFESAEIENLEILTAEQIRSVVESVLFSTDKPLSIAVIKQAFKGTQVKSKDIRDALNTLTTEYAESHRGFNLLEAGGGFQLRTKPDNIKFLRQSVRARPFRLSGPALEVLSIVAYKQPTTKNQIDEIRGVESGHLLRALMEKHLLNFGERSDLPGKPMFYETTRKFLEIFGLRNLNELPSLGEIDQLIPEGIGEIEDKETLSDLTGALSQEIGSTYSEGEDELLKITDELTQITTSSEFFEQEKVRMREKRDLERAQDIREKLVIGEAVDDKDQRWLERYDIALAEQKTASSEVEFVTDALADMAVEVANGEGGAGVAESAEAGEGEVEAREEVTDAEV